MKLNFLSTWISQKMSTLFLLTWLSANRVSAGQTFKNCLANHNDSTSYNNLLNFVFTGSDQTHICCTASQCYLGELFVSCNFTVSNAFVCSKVSQMITCDDYANCGGIVGDNQIITDTTVGNCTGYNLDTLDNYLHLVNKNISANNGYVNASSFLSCGWDNGGWTCSSHLNDCLLQRTASWSGSGPSSTNPALTATSLVSTSSNYPTSQPHYDNPTNNSDLPKILPPIIGGSLVIITTAGYCYYRKRKKNSLPTNQSNIELLDINRETGAQEVVDTQSSEGGEQVQVANCVDKALPSLPITSRQEELEKLVNKIKNKLNANLQLALETLLDTQAEITSGNNTFAIRQLQREVKEKLIKKLTAEEIGNLCQLQSEVTRLEVENEKQIQAQVEIAHNCQ